MRTILLSIPNQKELWYKTLFKQLNLKHRILDSEEKEDIMLAKLIDEAMLEKGEVPKDKIY